MGLALQPGKRSEDRSKRSLSAHDSTVVGSFSRERVGTLPMPEIRQHSFRGFGEALTNSVWSTSRGKRVFDLAVSAPLFVACVPAMAVIACAIKLTSKGPILFRQTRVGMGQVPFVIYKFRTMTADAEQVGPSVTRKGDLRLTRAGRALRAAKLDELPQLYNVLRGDMSLVGPRPKIAAHEQMYIRSRPGITGAATLVFAREEEMLRHIPEEHLESYTVSVLNTEKKRLDESYFWTSTFLTDFKILARTALHLGGGRKSLTIGEGPVRELPRERGTLSDGPFLVSRSTGSRKVLDPAVRRSVRQGK